ncbi:tetratricopeptide repeat protein [Flavobacterium zepuense]|uniref:Tetratricopeptide repeat protein n=1 Tax=Flavobacterium zepuense TaxID=2593302 RepID=A0A552V8K0_9FLAO|nr:tetratricopeptide repeat protein [Flavobacterium zepuense]TRW26780.1 tetratricopeptide repeat protein [Flavobacterium zepuense]
MLRKGRTKMWFSIMLLLLLCSLCNGQTMDHCNALLKKGTAEYAAGNYAKSLELYTEALALAEKNHWDKQEYDAQINIGNNYYVMLDYGEALEYFLKSYTTAVKYLTPKEEIASLNNIANLYTKEKLYEKAKEYYTRAYETAKEQNIESRMGLPLMNLGYIYNLQNQPQKARPYIEQSMPYLVKIPTHYLSAKVLLLENDLLMGNTKKARDGAWAMYESMENPTLDNLDYFIWQIVAKSYFEENNFKDAEAYAKKLLAQNPEPDLRRDVFDLLARIYKKSNNLNKALACKDSIIELDKRINDSKNGRLFENNRVRFEIENYKNQINANEQKITGERILFYSVLAVIAALVIIITLALRQKKMLAERTQHITAFELEKEKTNNLLLEKQITTALLEQERLKNEVENRNRKLSSKALYLSGRNELIEDFVTYLSKKPRLAKDPTIVSYIQSLKNHLKTDNEWDNFIAHFEEVNQGFLNRLKTLHPSLNSNDIRFIAYTYMNLSIKEIAFILNITVVACKKRKERIAAKMEIPKNVDLFDYISAV